ARCVVDREHEPMRREASLRPARHHEWHTRFDCRCWYTKMARQTGAEARRSKATGEIIDTAVALGLAQHGNNGFWADEPTGNGVVEHCRIGRSSGREAVDSSVHQPTSLRALTEECRSHGSLASAPTRTVGAPDEVQESG